MHRKLLLKAFEQAKNEVNSDKVFTRANHLSDQIYFIGKDSYGAKILSVKYNAILENNEEQIQIKPHAAEALSKYLGYDNFFDFSKAHEKETQPDKNKLIVFIKKHRAILIISTLLISSVFIYNYTTRQRWMVWQNDHYVEVDFNVKKYDVNQLKIYNEERILYFRKVDPKCDDPFFNTDGSVLIWYGKNKAKKLEYFTALGLHPETRKTLKPITQYMINKHICR